MDSFLIDHWKFIAGLTVMAGLGGLLVSITGRAALRKWLLNGTEESLQEVKTLLLQRIDQVDDMASHACPVIEGGGTPLTREQHEQICQLTQKAVLTDLENVKGSQQVMTGDIKKILQLMGGFVRRKD